MRLYNVHTLEETKKKISENFDFSKTEIISINDALGRITASDIISNINVPSFRRSTVDGYAVISSETDGASDSMPMIFKNLGEVEMGKATDIIIKGNNTVYVPTGGVIPTGADAMIMIEYAEKLSSDMITILKPGLPLSHIVKIGDDVKKNELIVKKGIKLQSHHIGVLAATGKFKVEVYKKVKVTIISTGDELVTSDRKLEEGEVFDINTFTLKNISLNLGLDILDTFILKDDKNLIKETISKSIENSDVVIVSGGSSVGYKDYTAEIIDELSNGEGLLVHGLAIKPGKPTIVGKVNKKMILGLPGHPVSAMIVYDQLMRMYLNKIYLNKPLTKLGILSENIHAAPGKETFVMVKIDKNIITPILGKSGLISVMSLCDGYIRIKADVEGLEKGSEVVVNLLD